MKVYPEEEVRAAWNHVLGTRAKIARGEAGWADIAAHFTEDAVYIDPAWGRIDGREKIREFFEASMAGLTGYGWSTPEHWVMVDGPRVVAQWDQILGERPDGTPYFVAGLSILYYTGNGLFCYSHDMLNMTHIGQTMKEMGWKPPAEFNMPPRKPNRDISLPKAWKHLEAKRP